MKATMIAGMVACLMAMVGDQVQAQTDYSPVLKPPKGQKEFSAWYAPYALASVSTRRMLEDIERLTKVMYSVKSAYRKRSRQSTKDIAKALSTLANQERLVVTFHSSSHSDYKKKEGYKKIYFNNASTYSKRSHMGEMKAGWGFFSVEISPPLYFDNLICYVTRSRWGRAKSLPPFNTFFLEHGLGPEFIKERKDGSLPICSVHYADKMSHDNRPINGTWFKVHSMQGLADVTNVYKGDIWVLAGQVVRISERGLVTIELKSLNVIGEEVVQWVIQ
ncbi:MAG: hypothetical protein OXF79_16080 [Chloroflexi bacterium]|nr:hypothetical protein [Chloroflexota bacterium]